MAWTAPRTWVSTEIVTASIMNTHVRDNFVESAPAKAASAGQLIVANAANSIRARTVAEATVSTSQTLTSTSYTDLPTAGPQLTTLTTGTTALIMWSAFMANDTAGARCYASIFVSGASSVSATDAIALRYESGSANDEIRAGTAFLFSGLTSGANTFRIQYRVTAGTGTFANRYIVGVSLS